MPRLSTQVTSVLLAASLAALAAHWFIDLAGDVVLEHDTYDAVSHGSRSIALVAALALLAALTFRFLISAVCEARGDRVSRRGALSDALPPAPALYVLVPLVSLCLVAGMEALDLLQAGGADDPGDVLSGLYGGSLWLGGGITILSALCASWALRATAKALGRLRRAIVAAVAALLHQPRPGRLRLHDGTSGGSRPRVARAGILARRAGKRAPPLVLHAAKL